MSVVAFPEEYGRQPIVPYEETVWIVPAKQPHPVATVASAPAAVATAVAAPVAAVAAPVAAATQAVGNVISNIVNANMRLHAAPSGYALPGPVFCPDQHKRVVQIRTSSSHPSTCSNCSARTKIYKCGDYQAQQAGDGYASMPVFGAPSGCGYTLGSWPCSDCCVACRRHGHSLPSDCPECGLGVPMDSIAKVHPGKFKLGPCCERAGRGYACTHCQGDDLASLFHAARLEGGLLPRMCAGDDAHISHQSISMASMRQPCGPWCMNDYSQAIVPLLSRLWGHTRPFATNQEARRALAVHESAKQMAAMGPQAYLHNLRSGCGYSGMGDPSNTIRLGFTERRWSRRRWFLKSGESVSEGPTSGQEDNTADYVDFTVPASATTATFFPDYHPAAEGALSAKFPSGLHRQGDNGKFALASTLAQVVFTQVEILQAPWEGHFSLDVIGTDRYRQEFSLLQLAPRGDAVGAPDKNMAELGHIPDSRRVLLSAGKDGKLHSRTTTLFAAHAAPKCCQIPLLERYGAYPRWSMFLEGAKYEGRTKPLTLAELQDPQTPMPDDAKVDTISPNDFAIIDGNPDKDQSAQIGRAPNQLVQVMIELLNDPSFLAELPQLWPGYVEEEKAEEKTAAPQPEGAVESVVGGGFGDDAGSAMEPFPAGIPGSGEAYGATYSVASGIQGTPQMTPFEEGAAFPLTPAASASVVGGGAAPGSLVGYVQPGQQQVVHVLPPLPSVVVLPNDRTPVLIHNTATNTTRWQLPVGVLRLISHRIGERMAGCPRLLDVSKPLKFRFYPIGMHDKRPETFGPVGIEAAFAFRVADYESSDRKVLEKTLGTSGLQDTTRRTLQSWQNELDGRQRRGATGWQVAWHWAKAPPKPKPEPVAAAAPIENGDAPFEPEEATNGFKNFSAEGDYSGGDDTDYDDDKSTLVETEGTSGDKMLREWSGYEKY